VLPHELDRSQKLLFETEKTGPLGLTNWMVRFCRFQRQSGALPVLDEEASPPAKRPKGKTRVKTKIKEVTAIQGVKVADIRSNL
jgi:hypothetical protein